MAHLSYITNDDNVWWEERELVSCIFLPILSIPFHAIPSPNFLPSNNLSFVTMWHLLTHSMLPFMLILNIIYDIND